MVELTVRNVENAPLKLRYKHEWLRQGKHTEIRCSEAKEKVEEIRSEAKDFIHLVSLVDNAIYELKKKNPGDYSRRTFNKKTVNDYFKGGNNYFACGAHATVACSLFRALGVPAKFVTYAQLDHPDPLMVSDHAFVKLLHPNGKWVYYDGTSGLLSNTRKEMTELDGKKMFFLREGIDAHECGIGSFDKLRDAVAKLKTTHPKTP